MCMCMCKSLFDIFERSLNFDLCEKITFRSSHLRCFAKKGDLKNFPKFTGKYLYQNLFFHIKLQA